MLLRDLTSLQDIVAAIELVAKFTQGVDHDNFDESLLIQIKAIIADVER